MAVMRIPVSVYVVKSMQCVAVWLVSIRPGVFRLVFSRRNDL